jgi:DNA mismatch repair ATPase MutS
MKPLYSLAEKLAWLDLFTSHALFAKEYQYIKPEITENSVIEIVG